MVRSVYGSDGEVVVADAEPSLGSLIQKVRVAAEQVLSEDESGFVSRADAASLLVAAVRLYALGGTEVRGDDLTVTPTEAVTVAAALLRSQQLTPFEFAIWFSHSGTGSGMEEG
jgi:hypothetical protein